MWGVCGYLGGGRIRVGGRLFEFRVKYWRVWYGVIYMVVEVIKINKMIFGKDIICRELEVDFWKILIFKVV